MTERRRPYRQLEWTPELVSRFWDWQSQFPEQYFTHRFANPIIASLRGLLTGRRRLLDYGCGTGFLLPALSALGAEVTGLDFSPQSVAATNKRHHGLPGFRGAFVIDELLARGETFDAILSVEVVEHLYDQQLDQMFATLRRLSAPGGAIVLTTPNDEDLSLSEIYCPTSDVVYHRYQHVRSWTAQSLAAAVEARGFRVQRTFTTDFTLTWRRPLAVLKHFAARALGRGKSPHLVCLAINESAP